MSGNILVVDDDKEIVQAIAINLEQEGFRVFKAYDGLEALEIAMSQDLQLIIIDVMMPKLDGLSAVLKIRERKNFPIMILSAKSEDTDKVLGLSGQGAVDILNIKCDPLVLGGLIDYQRYFPAYHMNKEKWVSAILNGTIPQEELFSLLRQSFALTKGK